MVEFTQWFIGVSTSQQVSFMCVSFAKRLTILEYVPGKVTSFWTLQCDVVILHSWIVV